MRRVHGWLLLVSCSTFCQKLFYAQGFEIEGDKTSCFCADRVEKSTPMALPITLKWTHAPKEEFDDEREAN